jgi:acetyltransferase-like isoleucine patch superfamily enzyme
MIVKVKAALRRSLHRPPSGMLAGQEVRIDRPNRISAPQCISIGDRSWIGADALITPIVEYAGQRYSPHISIGRDVYIGPHVYLAAISSVIIEDECVLSEQVYINDCSHGFHPDAGPIMTQPLAHGGDVRIGKSCFLGYRVAVLPGVELGAHCIVGINSVVTRSFPAYSMLAGSPARLIKRWSAAEQAWLPDKSSM